MALGSLISPSGSDFIKDWPGQNSVNCDKIDSYAGPCLRSGVLQTYTPSLTATTTDPTLGTAGIAEGWYYQIFDQIYTGGELRFDTGFTAGSGTYLVSLPFPAKTLTPPSTTIGKGPIIGNGQLWDNSVATARQPLIVQLRTTTQMMFGTRNNGSTRELGALGIIAWAVNDGISWFARYQRVGS
jgi:hypothetical protein